MKGPVICGVQDPSSIRAAKVARELARTHHLPLVYVHVVAKQADDHSIELRQQEVDVPGDFLLARGHHPTDCLLAIARERQASFLVLGNHGPRSSLLGSVSAEVARRASCPVVVVPPTAEAPDDDRSEADLTGGVVRLASHNGGIRRLP